MMTAPTTQPADGPRRRRWIAWLAPLGLLAAILAAWWWAARGGGWLAYAIRSPLFVRCGLVLLAATAALIVVGRAMARLGLRPRRSIASDQAGVAVLEFVLLFPIAMAIILVMIQSAMLMTGNLLVHYGAFCAARSAVVWIPADLRRFGEPPNVVASPESSVKLRRIRQAAVLGVLPAGAMSSRFGRPADAAAVRRTLQRVYGHYGQSPAGWLDEPLAAKYGYVSDEDHTWVQLSAPTYEVDHQRDDALDGRIDQVFFDGTAIPPYGPAEPITVTLHHRLYLSVPYANRLFGYALDGYPGHYATEIAVSYTLMNQGRYDDVILEFVPGTGRPGLLMRPR